MTDFKGVDVGELNKLAADLTQAGLLVGVKAYPIVKKGADNIMREARQNISGLAHAPLYPASITYDVSVDASGIVAEIGPDKDKPQGALGNILEYGAPAQNTPPQAHLGPALDRESPNLARYIAELGGNIL